MNAIVPASLARRIEADLLGKGIASRSRICRFVIIPGQVNQIMNAVIPAAMAGLLMASMLAKTLVTAATAVMAETASGGMHDGQDLEHSRPCSVA